jgi:hypothetical protein
MAEIFLFGDGKGPRGGYIEKISLLLHYTLGDGQELALLKHIGH